MAFDTNLVLGICDVVYGGVNLGVTKDFVTVTITQNTSKKDNMVGVGVTPLEIYDTGTTIRVTVPLAEYTLDNWAVALPTGTLTSDRVKVGGWSGTNVIPAQRLVLIPKTNNPAADLPFVIYQASVTDMKDISFNYETRVIAVEFEGLSDTTRPEGDRLFRVGGPNS